MSVIASPTLTRQFEAGSHSSVMRPWLRRTAVTRRIGAVGSSPRCSA
jgi:hypothetical protein